MSNFYLLSYRCGFFTFQLRAGGIHSGRIVPDTFAHFRTLAGHLPDTCAKSRHVTSSKIAEKMTRSTKLLFSTNFRIFGLLLANAKPFLNPKQIPWTYIVVLLEESHNTLVSHHLFDDFLQRNVAKINGNEKTQFFENHCFP